MRPTNNLQAKWYLHTTIIYATLTTIIVLQAALQLEISKAALVKGMEDAQATENTEMRQIEADEDLVVLAARKKRRAAQAAAEAEEEDVVYASKRRKREAAAAAQASTDPLRVAVYQQEQVALYRQHEALRGQYCLQGLTQLTDCSK